MVLKGVMDKKPKNSDIIKYAIFQQILKFNHYENEIFQLFHIYMVQKYQNEIAPTFYYGISTKTNEKDLKIPNLQSPD